jgi:hypothetical protein
MSEIVLTAEQAKVVSAALRPVLVRDDSGHVLGSIAPVWTEEDIEDAQNRLHSDEPRFTTAQVKEYLKSLKS